MPTLFDLTIPDETAIRVIDGMYDEDGNLPNFPDRVLTDAKVAEIAQRLRAIYNIAYIEHSLGPRELSTDLDKLLKGMLRSDVESIEKWTNAATFDPFMDLFQAAAVDIWKNSSRQIDYRDFRLRIEEPGPSSLRVLKGLAEHLSKTKAAFGLAPPTVFALALCFTTDKLKQDINRMYYKFFRPRSDRLPDKTIVHYIAEAYQEGFGVKFSVSDTNVDFRKDKSRRYHDGPPMRFACSVIRELELHQFMGPFDKKRAKTQPNWRPAEFPKHRSYDESGRTDNSVDLSHPFPWEVPKDANGMRPRIPGNSWEIMKNRIGDAWENK